MPYISGLSEGLKEILKDYCYRQRLTQVEWVAKHLDADIAAEQNPLGKMAGGLINEKNMLTVQKRS